MDYRNEMNWDCRICEYSFYQYALIKLAWDSEIISKKDLSNIYVCESVYLDDNFELFVKKLFPKSIVKYLENSAEYYGDIMYSAYIRSQHLDKFYMLSKATSSIDKRFYAQVMDNFNYILSKINSLHIVWETYTRIFHQKKYFIYFRYVSGHDYTVILSYLMDLKNYIIEIIPQMENRLINYSTSA
ncbi:MAG: hypothetical protein MJA82_00955 [Clostridia bacterium]|nr:hypothetical protein [Clostridia bacterium]